MLFIQLRQTAVTPPRRPFFYCFLLPFDCNKHLFLEGSFLEAVTVSTWILDITFHFHSTGKVWWLSKEDMGQTRVHPELEIISAWSYLLFWICFFFVYFFFFFFTGKFLFSHRTLMHSELEVFPKRFWMRPSASLHPAVISVISDNLGWANQNRNLTLLSQGETLLLM